jgi:hypothetical protein
MAKSEVLLGLIKEVVKNEVKQQLKEEIVKLVKSGAISLNNKQSPNRPSLRELTEVNTTAPIRKQTVVSTQQRHQPQREFSKDPMINKILNMTQPFTSAHRSEGGTVGGGSSILDSIQPERSMEEDWETLSYSNANIPSHQIPPTDNVDALTKALTRDYSELVKRFK